VKLRRGFPFRGFQIGAVAAAILLSYGIEELAATASTPLTTAIIGGADYVVRQLRLNVSPLALPEPPPWILYGYEAIIGVAAILTGLGLALWATKADSQRSPKPRRS